MPPPSAGGEHSPSPSRYASMGSHNSDNGAPTGEARAGEVALIRRAGAGDQAAWSEIYDRNYPPVYRYVRARIFDATAAEDVAAEVFLAAVRGIDRYRQQGRPLLAWLFGIAAHAVADYRRRTGRERRLRDRLVPLLGGRTARPDDVPTLTTSGEDDVVVWHVDLARAIEQLTAQQREVMQLRYFVGLKTAEIASILGKDASAIYSLHARALISLRERLTEEIPATRDESPSSRAISRVEA